MKLTGIAADAATPAVPKPIVCRKCRRPITPAPFIATWTSLFFQCHRAHPFHRPGDPANGPNPPAPNKSIFSAGEELGRVDQAPVDVFERLSGLPTLDRYLPQISTSWLVGWRDRHAQVKRPRAARSLGAVLRISPRTVPGRAWTRLLTSGLFIKNRAWGIVPMTSSLATEGSTPKSRSNNSRGPPGRMPPPAFFLTA